MSSCRVDLTCIAAPEGLPACHPSLLYFAQRWEWGQYLAACLGPSITPLSKYLGASELSANFPFTGEVSGSRAQLCFITVSSNQSDPVILGRAFFLFRASEQRKTDRAINIETGKERHQAAWTYPALFTSSFSLVKKGVCFLSRTHPDILGPPRAAGFFLVVLLGYLISCSHRDTWFIRSLLRR